MTDRLVALWLLQRAQQQSLGLDPEGMNQVESARAATDLLAQLHEEVTELGRLTPAYKRHLLSRPSPPPASVAEEVADVMKTLFALAQLHGLSVSDVVDAFTRKTEAIAKRSEVERHRLEADTRLICVDLDDVIVDARAWRDEIGGWVNVDAPPPEQLAKAEALKTQFYSGGRFRELPPMKGAPEVLRMLRNDGYKIIIVTARPQWQHKRLYADTVWWLDAHGVPCDGLLFNKDKVEALYEHIVPAWPKVFIEDHERNAKALASAGVQVLLFDQPHNQGVSGANIERVRSWAEIGNKVPRELVR